MGIKEAPPGGRGRRGCTNDMSGRHLFLFSLIIVFSFPQDPLEGVASPKKKR